MLAGAPRQRARSRRHHPPPQPTHRSSRTSVNPRRSSGPSSPAGENCGRSGSGPTRSGRSSWICIGCRSSMACRWTSPRSHLPLRPARAWHEWRRMPNREARKRVRRRERARLHALRQSESRKRSAERLELLAARARLPVHTRLVSFATDPALQPDRVSPGLIPAQDTDLVDLGAAEAVALVARIGGRRGAWGRP